MLGTLLKFIRFVNFHFFRRGELRESLESRRRFGTRRTPASGEGALVAALLRSVLALGIGVITISAGEVTNEPAPAKPFLFAGGTAEEFIAAVQKHFSVDWHTVVNIPELMQDARLPKMSISVPDPLVLLKYYNDVTSQVPSLGTWVWERDPSKPFFVVLVPDRRRITNELDKLELRKDSLTTISLRDVPRPVWINVTNEIEVARTELAELMAERELPGLPPNHASIDSRTGMLLIRGSVEFQGRVKAIVERHLDPGGARRMAEEIRTFSIGNLQTIEWPGLLTAIEITREEQKVLAEAEKRLFHAEGRTIIDPETRTLFAIGTADYADVVKQALQSYQDRKAPEPLAR